MTASPSSQPLLAIRKVLSSKLDQGVRGEEDGD